MGLDERIFGYWHILGLEISSNCLSVLNGKSKIEDINNKPALPISLCNVVYKIITKVLVNRMNAILGNCINESQGAFIPGRHISDNVLITYEVLHSLKMKKKGKKGNFALKLDMSKAYDRVE
ncbi:reverse transcriptase [Gossypium australe]|uniref:Reverse transcriptase n=1 Tax=Gossypium australe TaxID=47621 RepID=A0A5B6WN81_9ROSI|nr:reverse transcriptase [Gossypium australe]